MKNEHPDTKMEVYEVEEGSDPPAPKDHTVFMLDVPPSGPPAVGDIISVASVAVPPGDNPYVIDAKFEVLARTHLWLPNANPDGSWSHEHTYKKTWLTVRRLKVADIRAGKHLV